MGGHRFQMGVRVPLAPRWRRPWMAAGARSKFAASMFEPEVFRKQLYCIEQSTCDIVRTFHSPGNCSPLSPLVTPLVPRARSKFGSPMFEPEVFRKLMCCIEESRLWHCWDFRSPGNCAPLVTPLPMQKHQKGRKNEEILPTALLFAVGWRSKSHSARSLKCYMKQKQNVDTWKDVIFNNILHFSIT